MRPAKKKQSELLHPLNRILGTAASVRLLRVLALARTPLTAGELATRAELGRTSVYPALRDLEQTDTIEFVGAGAQRLVQLRQRHPLATQIRALFEAERARYDDLVSGLRRLMAKAPVRPLAAWIDEEGLRRPHEHAVHLHFIAKPADLEPLADYLSLRVAKIEKAFDVPIVLAGVTRSEADATYTDQMRHLANVILIAGVPPVALLEKAGERAPRGSARLHQEMDARARLLARAMALKIQRDPGIVEEAAEQVAHRLKRASAGERRELAEWARILETMSPTRLRRFLTEESERATRLRQTLPAAQLLTPKEREAVLRSSTEAEVAAAVAGK